MTVTQTEDIAAELLSTGPASVAHYVFNGHGGVTKAYVEGDVLEALCGYRWVPSKDPKSLPVCQGCTAIHDDNEAITQAGNRARNEGSPA